MTTKKSGRAARMVAALAGVALFAGAWLAWPTKSVGMSGPIDHVSLAQGQTLMPVPALDHGGELVIRGSVRTKTDGTLFDAAYREGGPGGGSRPGGLFEVDRAGLRVSEYDAKTHTVHLVSSGAAAPACTAAGLAAPCLVPRTKDLAFERLQTQDEFTRTLTGSFDADIPAGPGLGIETPSHVLSYAAGLSGLALLGFAFVSSRREKQKTLLSQIRAAAKKARAATAGDIALVELAKKVKSLEERAEKLDRARISLEERLATIDRAALEKKKAERAASKDDHDKHVLEVLEREIAEAEKIEQDLRASNAGLERILAALRVIPLSTREHKNVRVKTDGNDDVDAALAELDMREEAVEEADRVIGARD